MVFAIASSISIKKLTPIIKIVISKDTPICVSNTNKHKSADPDVIGAPTNKIIIANMRKKIFALNKSIPHNLAKNKPELLKSQTSNLWVDGITKEPEPEKDWRQMTDAEFNEFWKARGKK